MKTLVLISSKVLFADFCFNINENLLWLLSFWALLLVLSLHAKNPEEFAKA
jgi:hypothetical protein